MFAQTAADAKSANAPTNRLEAGSSILVSNLDPEVSAEDVKTIFGARGEVVKAVVNYDKDGTSLGTAEVTFAKADDAQKAVEEYDGAEVDGRAMYLKVVSTLLPPPPKQLVVTPSAAKIAAAQAQAQAAFYGQFPQPRAPRAFNVVRGAGRGGRGAGNAGGRGGSGSGSGGRQQQDNKPRANSKGPANRNNNGNGNGNAKPKAQGGDRGGKAARGGRGGKQERGGKKDVSAADLDAELDSYHGASKTAAPAAAAPAAAAPAAAAAKA